MFPVIRFASTSHVPGTQAPLEDEENERSENRRRARSASEDAGSSEGLTNVGTPPKVMYKDGYATSYGNATSFMGEPIKGEGEVLEAPGPTPIEGPP